MVYDNYLHLEGVNIFCCSLSPRDNTRISFTLKAAVPNSSIQCISPAAEPKWAGPIDATDCKAALRTLRHDVSRYEGRMFTIWSHKFGPSGPASAYWLLPYGKTSGKSLYSSSSVPPINYPRTYVLHQASCVAFLSHRKGFR